MKETKLIATDSDGDLNENNSVYYADEEVAPPLNSNHNIDEEADSMFDYDSWTVDKGNYYPTVTKSIRKSLSRGLYSIHVSRDRGIFFKKSKYLSEKYIPLRDSVTQEVINSIDIFFENRQKFHDYGFIFRRGILLHGPPGCGKTVTIKQICEKVISKYDGIVIDIAMCTVDLNDIFSTLVNTLRVIEKSKPIVILLEDIEDYTKRTGEESTLINLLDGFTKFDNVIYLGTTNNPEKLHDRILNRPNRFDKRILVGYPDPDQRREYLKEILKEDDLKQIDLDYLVNNSDKFTLSHLTELVKLTVVFGNSPEESIESLRQMIDTRPHSQDYALTNQSKPGFNRELKSNS